MDDLLLRDHELPDALRSWLKAQPLGCVAAIEQRSDGAVLFRRLPDLAPAFVDRVRVTFAHYREALMNLT